MLAYNTFVGANARRYSPLGGNGSTALELIGDQLEMQSSAQDATRPTVDDHRACRGRLYLNRALIFDYAPSN